MTVIKLPKTPAKAFNPKRPASTLLLSQIEHLEHAVGREPKRIKRTEGQAAKYIAQLTAELLKGSQQAPATAPSLPAGAAPVAAAAAPVAATPAQTAQVPVGTGTKKAATTAHAKFNETLRKRLKSKRRTPKKKATARRRTR